jgi:PilZN1 domain-containing protein/PilZ domain-containing protein
MEISQMTITKSDYGSFFRPGNIVNIGIDLPDKTFAEDVATVIASDTGEILLQLCGSGFPDHLPITTGSKVLITQGEGRSLFRCSAQLKSREKPGSLRIELPENIVVSERREYMRIDVTLKVNYSIPNSQNMSKIISEWDSMKGCKGGCKQLSFTAFPPGECRVNLSGSGLRFKIPDCLSYGTLLHLKIDLPEEEPEHIHAVGSIIRTKELLAEMDRAEYYSTSMSFRMIESNDRSRLINHILNEQRKTLMQKQENYL